MLIINGVFFTLKIAFFFTLISVCYAQTWEERSLLKAVKQEVNDNFGRIVAISKNYAAVGSSGSAGENKWPVYIYKKNQNEKYNFNSMFNFIIQL